MIARHFAHLTDVTDPHERHARWLTEVIERQARLIAMWQTLGFCHGVMNTDNCSILGLTLDYGPFGFMERFRAHHVCNQSDTEGRYAYRAQQQHRCDFTQTFRALGELDLDAMRVRFAGAPAFDAWWAEWQMRAASEGVGHAVRCERMRRVNPKFVLRNHLAQAAITAAERGDPDELHRLMRVLQRPFDDDAGDPRDAQPAAADDEALEVSCSS